VVSTLLVANGADFCRAISFFLIFFPLCVFSARRHALSSVAEEDSGCSRCGRRAVPKRRAFLGPRLAEHARCVWLGRAEGAPPVLPFAARDLLRAWLTTQPVSRLVPISFLDLSVFFGRGDEARSRCVVQKGVRRVTVRETLFQ